MNEDPREQPPTALIVDDEPSIGTTLAGIFSDEGWRCLVASSGRAGLQLYQQHTVDLVLLDVWMRGWDGITTLQEMRSYNVEVPIVVMSGHGTIETAVKATKLGAFNFLEKPLSLEKLIPMIEHAAKIKKLRVQAAALDPGPHRLIGESAAIAAIHRKMKVVAPRNSWVLITGENGTGKEVVARNIHLHSARAERSFVAVNCAAIPEELIESELFGHAKGAFTHAVATKRGRFELADHGTLFLDEIGDMSLTTQAKILRILQEQSFERLGEVASISVDVRVIAATNKNLPQQIERGLFREDLYYRLNVIPIHLVPLRERAEDIAVLARHFLQDLALELGEPVKTLTPAALTALSHYAWPGNVRELRNLIERLSILVPGPVVDVADLPEGVLATGHASAAEVLCGGDTLREARNRFERSFLLEKLEHHGWSVARTAEAIGMERGNLHRKIRSVGIDLQAGKHEVKI